MCRSVYCQCEWLAGASAVIIFAKALLEINDFLVDMTHFKGLVDPKMKILSIFSYAVPNPYEFTSSEEHKRKKLDKLYWLLFSIFNL